MDFSPVRNLKLLVPGQESWEGNREPPCFLPKVLYPFSALIDVLDSLRSSFFRIIARILCTMHDSLKIRPIKRNVCREVAGSHALLAFKPSCFPFASALIPNNSSDRLTCRRPGENQEMETDFEYFGNFRVIL